MLTTIGFAVLRLFKKDGGWTSPHARRVGLAFVILVLLALVLTVGKCAYDRGVIDDYTQDVQLDAAKSEIKADRVLVKDQKQFEAEQRQLEQAAREAKMQSPVEAAKPVGPVSRSYYDNLPEKK